MCALWVSLFTQSKERQNKEISFIASQKFWIECIIQHDLNFQLLPSCFLSFFLSLSSAPPAQHLSLHFTRQMERTSNHPLVHFTTVPELVSHLCLLFLPANEHAHHLHGSPFCTHMHRIVGTKHCGEASLIAKQVARQEQDTRQPCVILDKTWSGQGSG